MNAIRSTAGVSCVALAVAACAVRQPPLPPESLKSALPAMTIVPAAWKEGAGARGVQGSVVPDWVQLFADPQLDALVTEGLTNSLDIKAAASRIDVAIGLVVQARSLLYPQLGVIGGAGLVGRDFTKDRSGIVAEGTWELDLWGRVRAHAAAATAERQATEADLLFARQSLAATVATLWYHAIATERLRLTAGDAVTVYDELLQLVQMRNAVGQVGQQDVALASADLNRARQRERVFATSEQQIVRGLEVVVGRYPSAELGLAVDLPPLPGPVPEGLPSELLARRPDLVAAERQLAAAFHRIQEAQASRLPRLALTGAGGVSTSELLRLANVPAEFWSVGVNLLAPLFTGGALEAQVAIATADQRTAVALFGQAVLRAFSEVETSLAGERLLAEQQQHIESVLAQDTEALRLGRLRFDAGAEDLLHVLQLQARQLNTQFELIGIRNDRLANRVALHLALGGGFTAVPVP